MDLVNDCPSCGKNGSITIIAGTYAGDSGTIHKGYQLECGFCKLNSGWWPTIDECAERFYNLNPCCYYNE